MSNSLPPSPWRGPVRPPANPITTATAHRDLMADIHERVLSGLERAQALDAEARERAAAAAEGGVGESMDGAVSVRVDAKGMIHSAAYEPEVAELTSDELRTETMAALEAAKAQLGLDARPSQAAVDALFDRTVAEAMLRVLNSGSGK